MEPSSRSLISNSLSLASASTGHFFSHRIAVTGLPQVSFPVEFNIARDLLSSAVNFPKSVAVLNLEEAISMHHGHAVHHSRFDMAWLNILQVEVLFPFITGVYEMRSVFQLSLNGTIREKAVVAAIDFMRPCVAEVDVDAMVVHSVSVG